MGARRAGSLGRESQRAGPQRTVSQRAGPTGTVSPGGREGAAAVKYLVGTMETAAAPLLFAFNGDADGLCAQHIYALERGKPELRVTGWKRDIRLLARVPVRSPSRIRVFDISLDQNRDALPALLAADGIDIEWYDHHEPGAPPAHPRLALHVNQAPGLCTAAIVDAALGRRHRAWAALAAFGDNLPAAAAGLLRDAGFDTGLWARLEAAGRLLNYNAYGERPGDVLFEPADLAARMAPFASALDFADEASLFGPLQAQLDADRERFRGLRQLVDAPGAKAFLVPDEPWARRYGATWANERVLAHPAEALAILHALSDGAYLVSIRSAREAGSAKRPASDLAREFPTGGGRALAAGINRLAPEDFDRFLARFIAYFS